MVKFLFVAFLLLLFCLFLSMLPYNMVNKDEFIYESSNVINQD